jgi:sterol desaturase/sphingolipid hydroxylase (fatty acid hydroxylase superfamily)
MAQQIQIPQSTVDDSDKPSLASRITAMKYEHVALPDIPKEERGNVWFGIFGHLGSPIGYVVLLAIVGVDLWSSIWTFFAVSVFFIPFTILCERLWPALDIPKATGKEIWDGLFMVFIKGVAIGGGFVAAGWYVFSKIPLYGKLYNNWWLIAAATILLDFAYFLIHQHMSHSRGPNRILKFYRKKHAAHHSVTELDFLRGNQSSLADTSLGQFQPALIIISWLLGMDLAPTLVAYGLILLLQATDHTNITFNIGWLSYIFMDNHAHKLHHCKRGNLINHAAGFSFFDRWFGTYYEDWRLSSNYLHHNGIPLPIKRAGEKKKPGAREADSE